MTTSNRITSRSLLFEGGTASLQYHRKNKLKSSHQLRLCWFIAALLLCTCGIYGQATVAQANSDNVFHLADQNYKLSYTGSYRDFTIPAEAAGKFIYLLGRGADGGRINYSTNADGGGKGGQGATVSGCFKIGAGSNEIPVGATVRFIAAGKGASYTNHGQSQHHAGGGGGGTGILFLPPHLTPATANAEDWTILMVAGGGGGAFAIWGGHNKDGLPANDAETGSGNRATPVGVYGSEAVNHPRWEGEYPGRGGGGGTGVELMSDIIKDPKHPVTANKRIGGDLNGFREIDGKLQPVGHAGGSGDKTNNGGFGFGAGGAGGLNGTYYVGAGGGYGGGNYGENVGETDNHEFFPAGGGGSYVNTSYGLAGTTSKKKNGTTGNPGNGYATYRFSSNGPVSINKGFAYTTSQAKYLLTNNGYTLSWQGDGNLVLYQSGKALWASNTAGHGTGFFFQGDGNLVIRDSAGKAIWSSGTPDNWFDGKGGNYLQLSTSGTLLVINVEGKVLKQLH